MEKKGGLRQEEKSIEKSATLVGIAAEKAGAIIVTSQNLILKTKTNQ